MRATDGGDTLEAALDRLSELAAPRDQTALADLLDRLQERRLRVLVAGEAKRGKSTLVNALLGRSVLPSGVTPVTALATVVRYGQDESVLAVFQDGRTESHSLSDLNDLVTEKGNPGNRRALASVTATVNAPVLARGVELVTRPVPDRCTRITRPRLTSLSRPWMQRCSCSPPTRRCQPASVT